MRETAKSRASRQVVRTRRRRSVIRMRGSIGRGSAHARAPQEVEKTGTQSPIIQFRMRERRQRVRSSAGSDTVRDQIGAVLPGNRPAGLGRHGFGRNSMVPRRAPDPKSRTTSRRSPSGKTRSRMRRFGAVVIASTHAPRGISTAVVGNGWSALAVGAPRDIRPAMTATTAPKPTTRTMPIATTKIVSARNGVVRWAWHG